MLFVMLFVAVSMSAIPARRVPVSLTQPDGTTLKALLCGDEMCHYYTDTDGNMLVQDDDGYYRVATDEERQNVLTQWQQKLDARQAMRSQRTLARRQAAATRAGESDEVRFEEINPVAGKKRGLVILVEFLNLHMKTPNAKAVFTERFNKLGFNKDGHIGSVRDYFLEQSYGQLDITFDVIGPVRAKWDFAHYGANDKEGFRDVHVGELVNEAVNLVQDSVDFRNYDWNKDGEVDQIFIIYAGYGEHAGAASTTIWPHEWQLTYTSYFGDGYVMVKNHTRIDTYAMACELQGYRGNAIDGIGTACHEFSHCLGLNDTYDTSDDSDDPIDMDYWDLMAAGSYSGPLNIGEVPCGLSAYERHYAGWLDYVELTDPCQVVNMPSLDQKPVAYVIYNDACRNEYYTIENRQPGRWYSYVKYLTGKHGLLITHIDYDYDAWYQNRINSDHSHQRMLYVPSGKRYQYDSPVLFPGEDNVTEFTDTSHQLHGSRLFNKNTDGSLFLHKPITNIKEENGLVSFTFMGGGDNVLDGITMTNVSKQPRRYFTLDGREVASPNSGLYLIREGNSVKKIMLNN